ncbi:hypothetical protein KVT40_007721 [Elsinoe batatas]|uniref:Uncharacterized protein n=1 Tax=Elsinoe batatas TaxID=2601811 RepID=A0A8K0KXL6_9PEZI|nr:hypothetical protein KVT40_007721 [Elsinoe batatas]
MDDAINQPVSASADEDEPAALLSSDPQLPEDNDDEDSSSSSRCHCVGCEAGKKSHSASEDHFVLQSEDGDAEFDINHTYVTANFDGPFRLLDLPPEIRHIVWIQLRGEVDYNESHTFKRIELIHEKPTSPVGHRVHKLLSPGPANLLPSMQACRMIHEEAAPLMYRDILWGIFWGNFGHTSLTGPSQFIETQPWRFITRLWISSMSAIQFHAQVEELLVLLEYGKHLVEFAVVVSREDLYDCEPDEWFSTKSEVINNIEVSAYTIPNIQARCYFEIRFGLRHLKIWDCQCQINHILDYADTFSCRD